MVDTSGNLYIADSANNRVRKVANGAITTLAGIQIAGYSGDNGPASSAQLNNPQGLALDAAGIYILPTAVMTPSGRSRLEARSRRLRVPDRAATRGMAAPPPGRS